MNRCRTISSVLSYVLLWICLGACGSTEVPPADHEEANLLEREREERLWNMSESEVKRLQSAHILYEDRDLRSYLDSVAREVLPPEARERIDFDFYVIKNPVPNAFAFPDGSIFFHTGLLSRLENESQLALLIGHEGSHAIQRHSLIRLDEVDQRLTGLNWFSIFSRPFGQLGEIARILGEFGVIVSIYGYQREMEREADRIGFQYMKEAGFDVTEAPRMFQILNLELDEERDQPPYLYSTHPRNEERKQHMQEMIREMPGDARTGSTNTDRYRRRTAGVRMWNIKKNMDRNYLNTAEFEWELLPENTRSSGSALYHRARLYFYIDPREHSRKIQDLLTSARETGFQSPDLILLEGRLYEELGRQERRNETYRSFLENHPDHPRASLIRRFLEGEDD